MFEDMAFLLSSAKRPFYLLYLCRRPAKYRRAS